MKSTIVAFLTACGLFAGYSWLNSFSDLSILRAEFDVPSTAQVLTCKGSEGLSFLPREGLDIEVVFQLTDQDYAAYVASADHAVDWLPLPIPEKFLAHMGGVSTSLANRATAYQLQNGNVPEPGSLYNPSASQLLQRFVKSLPPMPRNGLFQVRSAEDNLMVSPKRIQTELNRDLNDFMLALLDHDLKRLTIKVRTSY